MTESLNEKEKMTVLETEETTEKREELETK